MNLPIHLDPHSDSVWTTYRTERDAAKTDVDSLKKFIQRWKDIYPFRLDQVIINEDVLAVVRTEKPNRQDFIALNIIMPSVLFDAFVLAKELAVPVNTAFIQANGGMAAFC